MTKCRKFGETWSNAKNLFSKHSKVQTIRFGPLIIYFVTRLFKNWKKRQSISFRNQLLLQKGQGRSCPEFRAWAYFFSRAIKRNSKGKKRLISSSIWRRDTFSKREVGVRVTGITVVNLFRRCPLSDHFKLTGSGSKPNQIELKMKEKGREYLNNHPIFWAMNNSWK